MREQLHFTEKQAKSGKYKPTDFYKDQLVMTGNHLFLSPNFRFSCRIFDKIIPEQMINTLELSANKAKAKLQACNTIKNKRGIHTCVRFGSFIERGGTGIIRISVENKYFEEFIQENKALWDWVSALAVLIFPDILPVMCQVPLQHCVFNIFSIGFWNSTPMYKIHRVIVIGTTAG